MSFLKLRIHRKKRIRIVALATATDSLKNTKVVHYV